MECFNSRLEAEEQISELEDSPEKTTNQNSNQKKN